MTPPPRSSTPSQCTCFRLRRASRRVTQVYDHALAPVGLSLNQYSILRRSEREPRVLGELADELGRRTVQAPPGVPVASLVAQKQVALGFQQLSEMMTVPGITLIGTLPADAAIVTTFSAGLPPDAQARVRTQALLDFMNTEAAAEVKRRHGMDPA